MSASHLLPPPMKGPEAMKAARRRKRLLLWSAPAVLAAMIVAFKLMSLSILAQQGIFAYDHKDFAASVDASNSLMSVNVIEPYIPYFNRGTAYAAAEYYTEGIEDLEKALERAPVEKQCDVRVNLALAWERLGDTYYGAGYYQGAVLLYQASEAVMAAAGEECEPPEDREENDGDSSKQLRDAKDRVEEKKQDAQEQKEANSDGEGDTTRQEQLDKLEEQSQQGAQEKATEDSIDRSGEGGRPYSDKPW